jgi:hypothetical protein
MARMGELSLKKLVFHYDLKKLPHKTIDLLPVQLYGINNHVSYIGNTLLDTLKQKGVRIPEQAMDFLSIAMAVTAADTFILRNDSEDGWHRQINLELPLCKPEQWENVKNKLEKALYFLSGDTWSFHFVSGGIKPPKISNYHILQKRKIIKTLNCVSLFSGGLDSAIGAIDLINEGYKPLLVSHSYRGDKSYQDKIRESLSGQNWHYQFNADPHLADAGISDISMRTRSFNFIAFGILSVCILQSVTNNNSIELIIPENGFISLNAPLTQRRIGSLSTRTTHPYFIDSMIDILKAVGLPHLIRNPYQFMTKGEMVINCKDKKLLAKIVDSSVSCSHWHRTNKQCGICVPCIIRRSALFAGNIKEYKNYGIDDISSILGEPEKSDDIQSLMLAIEKLKTRNISSWILNNAPLPHIDICKYEKVFRDGLFEVKNYLNNNGIKF